MALSKVRNLMRHLTNKELETVENIAKKRRIIAFLIKDGKLNQYACYRPTLPLATPQELYDANVKAGAGVDALMDNKWKVIHFESEIVGPLFERHLIPLRVF